MPSSAPGIAVHGQCDGVVLMPTEHCTATLEALMRNRLGWTQERPTRTTAVAARMRTTAHVLVQCIGRCRSDGHRCPAKPAHCIYLTGESDDGPIAANAKKDNSGRLFVRGGQRSSGSPTKQCRGLARAPLKEAIGKDKYLLGQLGFELERFLPYQTPANNQSDKLAAANVFNFACR